MYVIDSQEKFAALLNEITHLVLFIVEHHIVEFQGITHLEL